MSALFTNNFPVAVSSNNPLFCAMFDTDTPNFKDYKYLASVTYDTQNIDELESYIINSVNYARIKWFNLTDAERKFKANEQIFIEGISDIKTGVYKILKVVSKSVVIDYSGVFTPSTTLTGTVARLQRMALSPGYDDSKAKFFLDGIAKNLVSEYKIDLTDDTIRIVTGNHKEIIVRAGLQGSALMNFYRSLDEGGFAAFEMEDSTNSMANVLDTLFVVGNPLTIQHNKQVTNYTSVQASGAFTQLNFNDVHDYQTAQAVEVYGEFIEGLYNIVSIAANSIVIDLIYTTDLQNDKGTVKGKINQDYDNASGTAIITAAGYVAGDRYKVTTDLSYINNNRFNSGELTQKKGTFYSDYETDQATTTLFNINQTRDEYIENRQDASVYYSDNGVKSWLIERFNVRFSSFNNKFFLAGYLNTTELDVGIVRVIYEDNTFTFLELNNVPTNPDLIENKKAFVMPGGWNQLFAQFNDMSITLNTNPLVSTPADVFNNITFDMVKRYEVTANHGGTNTFQVVQFEKEKDCTPYDNYQLIFRDSKGSYLSYYFNMKSQRTLEIERDNYKRFEGGFKVVNGVDYYDLNDQDRGTKQYQSRTLKTYSLASNWVSDEFSWMVEELFKSSDVYIEDPNENKIFPVNISNDEIKIKKVVNDKLYFYTFDAVQSYNNNQG